MPSNTETIVLQYANVRMHFCAWFITFFLSFIKLSLLSSFSMNSFGINKQFLCLVLHRYVICVKFTSFSFQVVSCQHYTVCLLRHFDLLFELSIMMCPMILSSRSSCHSYIYSAINREQSSHIPCGM